MLFSDSVTESGFFVAALARLPRVGTRGPEPAFLISMGRAVTFLATIELFPSPSLGTDGTGGVLVADGVDEPDFTLTIFACVRMAC